MFRCWGFLRPHARADTHTACLPLPPLPPSRLEPHHFNVLALPVADFLADATGEPVAGVSPPAKGASFMQFARAAAGVRSPVAIAPTTPFIRVLELLGGRSPRIHRVYITEAGRPIGVVRAKAGAAFEAHSFCAAG